MNRVKTCAVSCKSLNTLIRAMPIVPIIYELNLGMLTLCSLSGMERGIMESKRIDHPFHLKTYIDHVSPLDLGANQRYHRHLYA